MTAVHPSPRTHPRRRHRLARYYYPVTLTYLCVMVTVVVFLLVVTEPVRK